MTKRTIEIDDTLQERVNTAIEEVSDLLKSYLDENKPDSLPCLHNDLDYSGSVHEIVDSSVPIYYSEIDDTFYLYGSELEDAYDNAGIGDKSEENWKQVAIYCYIEQEVSGWYSDNAQDIFDEWSDSGD